MPTHFPEWFGDIHRLLDAPYVGVLVALAAVICGGMIGFEREMAKKPAGLRTNILLCLGAAIFTQASILLAGGGGDRTRIAAQIVTGIGFLGAGAIFKQQGQVYGVTTGAGIWATAAVGMLIGGGYVVGGFVLSLLILATLAAERLIDRVLFARAEQMEARVEF